MYNEFQFKPSRLMYIIHGLTFIALQVFLYWQLNLTFWIICFIIHLISSIIFIHSYHHILYLGHLDTHQWTLITQHKSQLKQQITIHHMIDHLCYIVIYFETEHRKQSIVVWQDQLDDLHWKGLKARAKLKHFHS